MCYSHLGETGRALALVLLALGSACGADGPLDVYVDRSQCTPPCTVDRFGLFVLRGGCVYAWATKASGGDLTLKQVNLEQGTVQVLGTCGTESCVRCWASKTFDGGGRIDLVLKPATNCSAPQAVTTPCADCGAAEGAYCDGNRRVTCVNGKTEIQVCPESCVAGACGPCTKTVFYKDADGDTYGHPTDQLKACTLPAGYAAQGGDCDDGDPAAHPKQTAFFTQPTKGTKSFDYNCDNVNERQYPAQESCVFDAASNSCKGDGWLVLVPGCGQAGMLVKCTLEMAGFCGGGTPLPGFQACR
jgi:hypothetical protein